MKKANDEKPMKRIGRARIIMDAVLAHDHLHGRWFVEDLPSGGKARVREINAGFGWSALVSTRFSGLSREIKASNYDEAVLLKNAPPRHHDVMVDVFLDGGPKVLSVGSTNLEYTLITMVPGPWEEMFGLPPRRWSPTIAARMTKRELSAPYAQGSSIRRSLPVGTN